MTFLYVSLGVFILSIIIALLMALFVSQRVPIYVMFAGALISLGIIGYNLMVLDEPVLYRVLNVISYIMSAAGGGGYASIGPLLADMGNWHIYVLFMHIFIPILTGVILLSFLSRIINYFKYRIFRFGKKLYIFSHLNPHSNVLAHSIVDRGERCMIIFCNMKKASADMQGKIVNNSPQWVYTDFSEFELLKRLKLRNMSLFEISEDENENLESCMDLIDIFKDFDPEIKKTIALYLVSVLPETEFLLDSLDRKGISTNLINEDTYMVYKLLLQYPIYRALENRRKNKMKIVIIGTGVIGRAALKACSWCGIFPDVETSIDVYSGDVESARQEMKVNIPEIDEGPVEINYYTARACTVDFENMLEKHSADADYIIVALGEDNLNIKTAIYLRRFYSRSSYDFTNLPVIFVRVKDKGRGMLFVDSRMNVNKSTVFRLMKREETNAINARSYKIIPFGSDGDIYNTDILKGSPDEALARRIYDYFAKIYKNDKIYATISEADKRSHRAEVLHMSYKLWYMGLKLVKAEPGSGEDTEGAKLFNERLAKLDPELLERWEHVRWTAFERAQGFRKLDIKRAQEFKIRKQHLTKMHVCIADFDKEIPEICKIFNTDFVQDDMRMFSMIPEIVSGHYRIVERTEEDKEPLIYHE